MISLLLWGMTAECQNTQSNSVNMDQKFLQEEQKALKAIFSDKEILNNYNGAVVKDGEIVELTKANEDNGILFWHEHSPEWQGIIPEGVCRVYDPSWTGITNNTPAGLLKYQMLPTSIYASQTPNYLGIGTYINSPEAINAIEEIDPEISINGLNINYYRITDSWMTPTSNLFTNNQVITEPPHYAGSFNGYDLIRPDGMFDISLSSSNNNWYSYFTQTEYNDPDNNPIYTLRSGNYISLFIVSYPDPNNITKRFFILKWFPLQVENYYLGDVSVENHDAQQKQMAIYPNPTSDLVNVQLTINNEQLDGVEIQVFDVYGRRLLNIVETGRAPSPHTTQIDLSRYAQGVYFVKAVSEGKVIAVRKVVKR